MTFVPNALSDQRDAAVLRALEAREHVPLEWAPVDCSRDGMQATVFCTTDALRLTAVETATSTDDVTGVNVRLGVSATLAQHVADLLGCCQTTARIEDLAWQQASAPLEPQLMPAGPAMTTTAQMIAYSRRVDAALAGRVGLARTVGKSWILTPLLWHHPLGDLGAVNYGFHTRVAPSKQGPFVSASGLTMWQTIGRRHDAAHADYSQTLVLVHPDMIVDGVRTKVEDVMQDPGRARLLCDDGVCPTRHPAIPRHFYPDDGPPPPWSSPPAGGGAGSGSGSPGGFDWPSGCALVAGAAVGYAATRALAGSLLR